MKIILQIKRDDTDPDWIPTAMRVEAIPPKDTQDIRDRAHLGEILDDLLHTMLIELFIDVARRDRLTR